MRSLYLTITRIIVLQKDVRRHTGDSILYRRSPVDQSPELPTILEDDAVWRYWRLLARATP